MPAVAIKNNSGKLAAEADCQIPPRQRKYLPPFLPGGRAKNISYFTLEPQLYRNSREILQIVFV